MMLVRITPNSVDSNHALGEPFGCLRPRRHAEVIYSSLTIKLERVQI